jgi:predicted permease
LPITLFNSIYSADLTNLTSLSFVAFAVGATIASFTIIWAVSVFLIKDKSVLGAFVQGAFRSNMVFVGLPLMRNLYGEEGVAHFALIVVFIMPLYNVLSAFVLSAYSGTGKKFSFISIAGTVLKTPIIIASLIGIMLSLLNIPLPQIVTHTLSDLSHMTTPMALLCLGGGITFLGFDKKFKYALTAAVIKIAVLPIVFTAAAYFLGFRGLDLVSFMVLGGTSTAIISYTMAVQMDGDGYTAANIVLFSTLLSAATLTLFIYTMTVLGLLM